jgi:Nucleotide modification associated domain 2
MSRLYIYVVDRDFGFAPNPFHGFCTLATCKPKIRNAAEIGDWVVGMGGSRLKASGKCIFAMRISNKITFNEYWTNPKYLDKKPIRNGSRKMMVGDNVYYLNSSSKQWQQADSHHSNADGSINPDNLTRDTSTNKVLISNHFFYFGIEAPIIPERLLSAIGYKNGRNYRVFELDECMNLFDWLQKEFGCFLNTVQADPFDFNISEKRYSARDNKVS